jgi:ABC-type methionine transport system ATPase subunit
MLRFGPSIVRQIEETLIAVRARLRICILLGEQYLDFARSIGDKFYVMRRGQIVATGNPRESDPSSVQDLPTMQRSGIADGGEYAASGNMMKLETLCFSPGASARCE